MLTVKKTGPVRVKLVTSISLALVLASCAFLAAVWLYNHHKAELVHQQAAKEAKKIDAMLAVIEAKKKEPVYITLPGANKIRAIVEDYDQPDSLWAMANKTHALPMEYVPNELAVLTLPTPSGRDAEGRSVDKRMQKPLEQLFAAAKAQGHELMVGSAYRSSATQTTIFNAYVAESGMQAANQYSAKPGESEHQLGLSVDISTLSQNCYLSECFIGTPDGEWLAAHAHEYGMVLRYPKGKEAITGYNFEPWHYRYVGTELAGALYQSGFTFEEAWPYLQTALATLKANRAL